MDTTRCVACRRRFERGAAPRWAFDAHGRPLGAIHITCAGGRDNRARYRVLGSVEAASAEEAQRGFYIYVLHDARTDWWDAEGCALVLLGYGEDDALNAQQRALLRRWVRAEVPLPLADAPRIEAAYARILADFRAWRERPIAA